MPGATPPITRRRLMAAGGAAALMATPAGGRAQAGPGGGAPWVTPAAAAPGLEQVIFRSRAAAQDVSFHVLAPRGPHAGAGRRYPVVYWLHGTGGALRSPGPISRIFGEAMEGGAIPPAYFVLPNGLHGSLWCDAHDGSAPVETILIREILPLVDERFATDPVRERRMIEGFSMGGFGAARLGFRHRELFGAVSSLAGGPLQAELTPQSVVARNRMAAARILDGVFGGDQGRFQAESPRGIAASDPQPLRSGLDIRIAVGGLDQTLPANGEFSAFLRNLRIPHAYQVLPGVGHDAPAVIRAMGWDFHRTVLRG